MAEIRPFRGVRYNKARFEDLSLVICPPYDVISPQRQQELYQRSGYNFIRVEFPIDIPGENKYSYSANHLENWLKQGILKVDESPAFYIHDHYFTYQNKKCHRRHLMARIRLEEWDRMVVRPHEGTLPHSKSDRLNLLWACQANTSPILGLFEDKENEITALLSRQIRRRPVISTGGADGESHRVWAIRDLQTIGEIVTMFTGKPLYIADGHHRYESALTYRRERYASSPSEPVDAPFNYVLMALVAFEDPGLVILPPHRLVRGLPRITLESLLPKLREFFEITELALESSDVWRQVDELMVQPGNTKLAVFGLDAGKIFVLKLNDLTRVKGMMPYFHSELYKSLDVSIVDHVILEELLELSRDKEEGRLSYSYDRGDAVKRVRTEEYQLALLLNPVKATTIKAVADAGDRMPRKSTYFYPKSPAGLVINRFI